MLSFEPQTLEVAPCLINLIKSMCVHFAACIIITVAFSAQSTSGLRHTGDYLDAFGQNLS